MSVDRPYLWWRDGVIYQIYPRSFMDSNGDGIGDLPGITARLDYLADLGVDALWLSPINVSPMHDFGYDIADYEEIDPVFGTRAEFDGLIAEAHARGLRIMMDLVINHTSHKHSWFTESRSSRDNPKADWYLWRGRPAGRRHPNNWTAAFGGPAWEWDEARRQFYYHMFLREQPDLNWRNPEVRAALQQMIRFWLDRGVDGFRLDVVNGYFKDAHFRDNPPRFNPNPFALEWDRQAHVYDRDQPELHDAYRELRRLLDSYPERTSVGEVMGADPSLVARYLGDGTDQLHMAFNFAFTHQPWRPRAFQQAIAAAEAAIAPGAWPCYVLSNHDMPRHVTRHGEGPFADARAKVAAALLLTLRGTPFLYMGEEIGMRSPRLARRDLVDPLGRRGWPFDPGRDNARTPMQWDDSLNAGFSAGRPWLPVGPTYRRINVAAQQSDPNSVLNVYQRLLRLRRASPALRRGSYRPLRGASMESLVYVRATEQQKMLVALNLFGHPVTIKGIEPGPWARRFSTHSEVPAPAGQLRLAPFEATVFELEK